jgi:hypothetical protein
MSNVEGMYSACRELLCRTVYFKKRLSKAKPPFDILRFDIRYSAVLCSGHLKLHMRVPGFQGSEVPGYGFDNPER